MKKKLLNSLRVLLVAAGLGVGANASWAQELTAVTTETTWDFASITFTKDNSNSQIIDNIYIGAGVSRDGTNGRVFFNGTTSSTPSALGSNMIAIKVAAEGQLLVKVASYQGNVLVSDGTSVVGTFEKALHGGSNAGYRGVVNTTSTETTYYFYTAATSNTNSIGVFSIHFVPKGDNTTAFSDEQIVTKDLTTFAEQVVSPGTYNGITLDNLYLATGVDCATADKTRLRFGGNATVTGNVPSNYYISFKLPAGSGTLTIKPSCYSANAYLSNGASVVKSFSSSDHGKEYNYAYSSETETTFYLYTSSYNSSQNTGVLKIAWQSTDVHTYTVNAVDGSGNILSKLASGNTKKDLTYNVSGLQKVISKDGKYYVLNDGAVSSYSKTFTMGSADEVKTVTYAEDGSIVYYVEVENLSNAGKSAGSYSGGYYGYIPAGKGGSMGSLDAGNYQVEGYMVSNTNRGLYLRTSTSNSSENVITYIGNESGTQTKDFTLASTTNLFLTGYTASSGSSVNQSADIDYVIIRLKNVSKTITSAGWATYCSPYALDLENATNLADAYIVTGGAGGVLTKTSVKGGTVPANTGLLLKGTEGSAVEVTIPVIASSTTDVSANKLEGKTAEYALAAKGGYVLMNDATNGLGFYLNTNAFTVGANTAYLPNDFDSTGGEARSFFALFGDDATGIEDAVKSEEIKVKSFFNLNGQRVNQPTKGLYIVNGKKVIIK